MYLHLRDGSSRSIWSDHIQTLAEFAQDRDVDSSFSLIQEHWMDSNYPVTLHQVVSATQSQGVFKHSQKKLEQESIQRDSDVKKELKSQY